MAAMRYWVLAMLAALSFSASFSASAQGHVSFDSLERALRLNPYQKQRFDVAVTATHRAAFAIGMGALQAKSRVAAELLKERPDPRALSLAQDELVEFSQPHVRSARDAWMQFYATLDDEQVRVARGFVEEKLKLVEQLGAHLGKFLAEKLP